MFFSEEPKDFYVSAASTIRDPTLKASSANKCGGTPTKMPLQTKA
jgi:hypothetical protein